MMTLKNSIALLLIGLVSYGQNSIKGNVENWSKEEATVTENNFWTGDKKTLSTIDKAGNFIIPLDPDYFNTVKKRMEEEEKDIPRGGEIKYHRVNTVFECSSESFGNKNITEKVNDSLSVIHYPRYNENNKTTFTNAETIVSKLPLLYLTDKNGNSNSLLYAASNPELAKWSYWLHSGDVKKGYCLEWIFVDNNATVKGACVIPTFSDGEVDITNTNITDLELKKGWNIIKYDITEVFTSPEGDSQPVMTKITVISEMPKDVKWYAVAVE